VGAGPLSLVLLSAALLWTRLVPRPLALALLIAGVAFPLSRIGRIDLVAHAVDVLLLGASAWLATPLPAGTSSVRSPNAC
jgi:enoyl-CoA hydratase/carnithine racemase